MATFQLVARSVPVAVRLAKQHGTTVMVHTRPGLRGVVCPEGKLYLVTKGS